MSTQPDWSKAPEWAHSHGLNAFNGELRQYWIGENQYQCLDHQKPFPYGGGTDEARHNHRRGEFKYVTKRPAPWTGEGLPPAGIDIEVMHGTYGWIGARVVGHDGEAAIVRTNDGYAGVYPHEFRAIRTPEQIAAVEREKAVEAMIVIAMAKPDWRGTCEALYDAGYRRQVAP